MQLVRRIISVFILAVCALICFSLYAQATVTITVHPQDLSSSAAPDGSTSVVATLRGCGSNPPIVVGTSMLAPTSKTFTPVSGVVTMPLYSSSEISCGGQTGVTGYDITMQSDGSDVWKASYTFSASGDLSTMTPNTSAPVVAAPTGDTTYARVDNANTGSWFPLFGGDPTLSLGGATKQYVDNLPTRNNVFSGSNSHTGPETFSDLDESRARIVRQGLLGEFNFSDGTGTTLSDISGNGNNGTLSGASWISGGGVSCNGSSTIPLPLGLSGAKSIMVFQKYGPFNSGQQPSQLVPSVVANTDANGIFLKESYKVADANSSSAKMNGAPALMQTGATAVGTFEPAIGFHMITANLSTPQGTLYVDDGAALSYYVNTGVTTPSLGQYQFCGSSAMSGSFWTGSLYYAAFYDHALSASEVGQNYRAVVDYLRVHGVNMTPPRSSWAKTSRLILSGDSITENNYAQYMGTLDDPSNEGWATTIDGVSGSWTYDVQANIPWRESTLVVQNGARCAAIIEAVTNNINGGMTVADAFASWMAMMRTAKQSLPKNCPVMSTTMIDRNGFDTQKNALNALIRARFSEVSDWLVDFAADPNLGCDGCSANATYFQQTGEPGVHPTLPTGETLLANLATNAVNAAYGVRDASAATIITSASSPYTEAARDMYINVDPTSGNVVLNLPDAMGYTGDPARCVRNVSTTSPNTVTVNTFGSENFDSIGPTSLPIPNSTTTCFIARVTNASVPFTTWYRQNSVPAQSPFFGTVFNPLNAGGAALGDAAHPWSGAQIGTDATNRVNQTASGITAARAVVWRNIGATDTATWNEGSGTATLGTSAIASATCATAVTVASANVLATDSIAWSFNAAPGTGYTAGLRVLPYVTAGNVNFLVCNATAGSLTPAAATLNWKVTR